MDTNGIHLYLVDENGAVMDDVAYTGAECVSSQRGRRLKCRAENVVGSLGLVRKGSARKYGNSTFSISGTFKRRNITALAAATGLGVTMMLGPAVVPGRCVSLWLLE